MFLFLFFVLTVSDEQDADRLPVTHVSDSYEAHLSWKERKERRTKRKSQKEGERNKETKQGAKPIDHDP